MQFIYTADLHGQNIDRLFGLEADVFLLGGDIAPHGPSDMQEEFIRKEFMPRLRDCVFLIPGNDDHSRAFKPLRGSNSMVSMRKAQAGDLGIIGYPYVPITPFGLKDWEKWDDETQPATGLRLEGIRDDKRFVFQSDKRQDTIEKDMKSLAELSDPKRTIYIFHSPPMDTNLDIISTGAHVGSRAIRGFIEKHQPFLTLHGHIHETVERSGQYLDRIGDTMCATAGNSFGSYAGNGLEISQ